MLSSILAEFDQASASVCSDEIAQRLGVELALLNDMFDMLVRMGKLIEVHSVDECAACQISSLCRTRSHVRRTFLLSPDQNTS
jgi:hypothetical protein